MASAPASSRTDTLFEADGHNLYPTILSQGPWDPGAQHGGPPCAAMAWCIDAVPTLVPMQVSRYTFELFRAVPLTTLTTKTRVVREGKRLQLVEAMLCDGDLEVARGTALRLRVLDLAETGDHPLRPQVTHPPAPNHTPVPTPAAVASRIGFIRAIDIDRSIGGRGEGAPCITWYRAKVPLILGHEWLPLARLALFADFTSATASYLDIGEYSVINPDVTVQVLRPPVGEWICLDCVTDAGSQGIGHSNAVLFDQSGFIGTSSTSQLVDRVRSPFAQ